MSKPPIWAVAAPGARKTRFSREQIAQAALHIADSQGFESLSMRRVADELGAGTMTLYYYVRTKEDLLALVEDTLMGETSSACDPLPKRWRSALVKLATATRDTYLRHPWALRSFTGERMGPNGLRHVEQSLQAVASLRLPYGSKLQILAVVDDYVYGHCAGAVRRRDRPNLDRKGTRALTQAMQRNLHEGDYPQLRIMIGDGDPIEAFAKSLELMAEPHLFETGLEALLDGLARRFDLK